MTPAPVRVGLIGCGRIAQLVHLPTLRRLPGVAVVALAEPDPQRRAEAQRLAPQAQVYADASELLARPDIDAVVVAAPNAVHAPLACAAFAAGKHVYLEKPLATTLDDGEAVVAAWRASGRMGMIGFNFRFNPLYQALRDALRRGEIRVPVAARSVFTSAPRQGGTWQAARASGGGVLLDLASHHVDLVHFLFGESRVTISASLRSVQSEDDTAFLRLTLADGLAVETFVSTCAVDEDRFEVYGPSGKLSVDRLRGLELERATAVGRASPAGRALHRLGLVARSSFARTRLRHPTYEPSYMAALSHFALGVQSGRLAPPDLMDGLRSLRVVLAAEEAARTGHVVHLDSRVGEPV